MNNGTIRITYSQKPKKRILGFSDIELKQLGISMLVLTIAFAMALGGGVQNMWYQNQFVYLLPLAAIAVITAFVFHEMAHKFMAQRFGCWAEFRYWQFGLLIALMSSMLGFLFAAPGAVIVSGRVTLSQNGKISAAGPITNIAVAGVFAAVWLTVPIPIINDLAHIVAFVNVFIGGFNLIPIMPFDGAKIVKWSIPVYAAMVAAVVFLLALTYGLIPGMTV